MCIRDSSDTVINPIIDVLCIHTHIHVCMLLPDIDECSGDADMPTTVSPLQTVQTQKEALSVSVSLASLVMEGLLGLDAHVLST